MTSHMVQYAEQARRALRAALYAAILCACFCALLPFITIVCLVLITAACFTVVYRRR